ncbi:hypothetical protein RclHR1_05100003 [Rhizophagus clarus]|uniref:BACK domain-containing protein n=1 Tax=Rhizophagus clarus TaxID=94130 RepID=A0A2Z6SDU8_9GLOM|nr:hypothetical protein RclHR1_05100003 [Rhizophagus clarus]
MSLKFLKELSNDYEKLFETEMGYDVVIYAGKEPNVKEIHAHSNILCIRFIYSGNIELENLQEPDVMKLLIAVDELNIQQLIPYIQEYLIKHQTEFLYQNPIGVLETIYQHKTFMDLFTDLWDFCLEKVCEEPKILFNSDEFINLEESLLESLLKSDNLNMDEIKIWEGLLKWCFAQQNMENDPTKWTKDDITKIEESLQRFIPLMRFYDIEPTDFFFIKFINIKISCHKI